MRLLFTVTQVPLSMRAGSCYGFKCVLFKSPFGQSEASLNTHGVIDGSLYGRLN